MPTALALQQAQRANQAEQQQQALADLLTDPSAVVVHGDVTGGGAATAILTDDRALFSATGLPDPGDDKAYQLWVVDADGATSAGVLADDATVAVRQLTDDFVAGQATPWPSPSNGGRRLHPADDRARRPRRPCLEPPAVHHRARRVSVSVEPLPPPARARARHAGSSARGGGSRRVTRRDPDDAAAECPRAERPDEVGSRPKLTFSSRELTRLVRRCRCGVAGVGGAGRDGAPSPYPARGLRGSSGVRGAGRAQTDRPPQRPVRRVVTSSASAPSR